MDEQNANANMGGGNKRGVTTKIIVIVAVVVALGAVWALARRSNEAGKISEGASVSQEPAAEEPAPNGEASAPEAPPVSNLVPAPGVNPDEVEEKVAVPAEEEGANDLTPPAPKTMTVTFTDSGYSPQTVTIKKGDSVLFKNASASETWPASALHPTHTVYPSSDIKKCGTAEAAGIFDACRGVAVGGSWTFQFNEVGSWKYHDHLNPSKFGTIVVEP